jgi:pectate lyase
MVKTISPAMVSAVALLLSLHPAAARGGHKMGHGFSGHGMANAGRASSSTGGRHDNDAYVRAVSEERGRLLDTQIKSICRGC